MNYVGKLKDEEGNTFYPETLESNEVIYSGWESGLTLTLDKTIKGCDEVEVIFQRGNDYGSASTGRMIVQSKDSDNANAYGTAELIYINGTYQARITIKVEIVGNTLTKRSHRINFDGNAVTGPANYDSETYYVARVIGYKRVR